MQTTDIEDPADMPPLGMPPLGMPPLEMQT